MSIQTHDPRAWHRRGFFIPPIDANAVRNLFLEPSDISSNTVSIQLFSEGVVIRCMFTFLARLVYVKYLFGALLKLNLSSSVITVRIFFP